MPPRRGSTKKIRRVRRFCGGQRRRNSILPQWTKQYRGERGAEWVRSRVGSFKVRSFYPRKAVQTGKKHSALVHQCRNDHHDGHRNGHRNGGHGRHHGRHHGGGGGRNLASAISIDTHGRQCHGRGVVLCCRVLGVQTLVGERCLVVVHVDGAWHFNLTLGGLDASSFVWGIHHLHEDDSFFGTVRLFHHGKGC